ncbi:hypothetical protein ACOTI9_14905 [Achromobacter mucicolens]|uniref:hypothetical protein n=1 Tax=Achromobacter mucicolens TaxID=1389922 RepID=UPI003B99DED7
MQWRALFWEPVAGTGERLMVGVLHRFAGDWASSRILRDDVLDSLYGQSASAARQLIDFGLALYVAAAKAANDIGSLNTPLAGLSPGPVRATAAKTEAELLRTAALLYSSLAQMDLFDSDEEGIAPQAEEVTRRFSTEVRTLVIQRRPELTAGFGRGGSLIPNGPTVKFGFLSSNALIHFSVLNAVRQTASVKDARAKLWELARASDVSGIKNAALIAATPRHDDPTLGPKQRENLIANRLEMEREADAVDMRLLAVTSVAEAADKVIAMATA